MTVVPCWIHSPITAINVSAVLSVIATREVFLDSSSTRPNTYRSLKACFLLYSRRLNLFFLISRLVRTADPLRAGHHIQQNDHFAVLGPVRYGYTGEQMSSLDSVGRYAPRDVVKNVTPTKVTLCLNHEPYLIELETAYGSMCPLRDRHLKTPLVLLSSHQDVSEPRLLHCVASKEPHVRHKLHPHALLVE
jgi:hypothetical protein